MHKPLTTRFFEYIESWYNRLMRTEDAKQCAPSPMPCVGVLIVSPLLNLRLAAVSCRRKGRFVKRIASSQML